MIPENKLQNTPGFFSERRCSGRVMPETYSRHPQPVNPILSPEPRK